ncbi:MAG: hypothetical protein IPF46_07040 [Saprospiraceae bacterium]|mgnify:CR=1 FL=1|nr:hypothetical protein [Candidatus Vicinibacter affinis]MBK6574030.1 hypothetical protein [Candidatus Vicinibacter affinis]MBK7798237.1 hypothetical protein [Candidatus Vicinibacter affinis]MBK8642666.1 hypothetical protein [Candidatus Vicinibacter affinis]
MLLFTVSNCKFPNEGFSQQKKPLEETFEMEVVPDDTVYYNEDLALTQGESFKALEHFPIIVDTIHFIEELKVNCHLNSYGYKRDWQITEYKKI